jgi:hypothetical protein
MSVISRRTIGAVTISVAVPCPLDERNLTGATKNVHRLLEGTDTSRRLVHHVGAIALDGADRGDRV